MSLSESESDSENQKYSKKPRLGQGTNGTLYKSDHKSEETSEHLENMKTENHSGFTDKNKEYIKRNSTEVQCNNSFKNQSSPIGEEYDDFKTGFRNNDEQSNEISMTKSNHVEFYNNKKEDYVDDNGGYSATAKKMMSNMGFKIGKGLGKKEDGIVEPVEASSQDGRRGLGMKPSLVGELPKNFKWTSDYSKASALENVTWCPNPTTDEPLTAEVLEKWLQRGPKDLDIKNESNFVDPQILNGVLEAKTIFDSLNDKDLRHARFRSNPFETIGAVIFLNRAAVKMANIDAIFNFMFTDPKDPDGKSSIDNKDLLYFADVCAGPGGFSEYILYRKGWMAKGFGFTLKEVNDFKVSEFYAGPPETFNTFYGVKDDGNIYNPANLESLKARVLDQTDNKGVHFLMADGGFSVENQENLQEILSKQLYLCQCLAALMLVRTGGHFVVKLFDVFTLFSVGLIYIMYRCFDEICIHKPVTSRPANSERYLICKGKKLNTDAVEKHLSHVNNILWNESDRDDVTELVPLEVLKEDEGFFNYVYRSNCVIGERQIQNLIKIAEFSKNKQLKDPSQYEIREECLRIWNLPNNVRMRPVRLTPEETLMKILSSINMRPPEPFNLQNFKKNFLCKLPDCIETTLDFQAFRNVYDWQCTFLSRSGTVISNLKILLGCGGKDVFELQRGIWISAADLNLTLPANTLIYGEIVKEFTGQLHAKSLHVIDALMLGGLDVSYLSLTDRQNKCRLFCAAISKPYDTNALPVRCKRFYGMEQIASALDSLEYRDTKRMRKALTVTLSHNPSSNETTYHEIGSVLFMREIKDPWTAQWSKSHNMKYFFAVMNDKPVSVFELPPDAPMDMLSAFHFRLVWQWEDAATAIFENEKTNGICREHMNTFVRDNIVKR